MSSRSPENKDAISALEQLRRKIESGSNLLVEALTDEELEAMHELLLEGKAEIISQACRPYLSARQERFVISH